MNDTQEIRPEDVGSIEIVIPAGTSPAQEGAVLNLISAAFEAEGGKGGLKSEWTHKVVDRVHSHEHAALPPGTHLAPYLWRATLRDGTILVRGDKSLKSPHDLPKGVLAKLELLPAIEGGKWKPMSVDLGPEDVLIYDSVMERRVAHGPSEADKPWVSFEGCAAVRLGVKKPDGSVVGKWAYLDGRVEA